jgi:MFS family permease
MLVMGFYESVTFAVIAALHRPASFFGVLMSVQAAGSIAGGLTAPRMIGRIGELRSVALALAVWALASGLYSAAAMPAAFVALVLLGAAGSLFVVATVTANQRNSPPELQGRVSAASDMAMIAAQSVSIAIGAALVDTIGYRPLLAAAVVVLATPAAALALRGTAASGHEQRPAVRPSRFPQAGAHGTAHREESRMPGAPRSRPLPRPRSPQAQMG